MAQLKYRECFDSPRSVNNVDGLQKLVSHPSVLSTIQTPYGNDSELHKLFNVDTGKIWISGSDSKIYQISQTGTVLKIMNMDKNIFALSSKRDNELILLKGWNNSKIYKYDGNTVQTFIDLYKWYPQGLCHAANFDLCVSMRSVDKPESRVVRYSGTKETMIIQNDSEGKPLFSVGVECECQLTTNGNGDICVADKAGQAVVVVDGAGKLRFKYKGNFNVTFMLNIFSPSDIVTDINNLILISYGCTTIDVIDSDGNFLRYLYYSCSGGMSIDIDNNLVVGDSKDGKIKIIKYLQ
ncbi:uncharacterized protein LOC144623401 [Crassostrea virginica]